MKHNYQTEKNKLIHTNKQDSQRFQLTKADKMIACRINDCRELHGKGRGSEGNKIYNVSRCDSKRKNFGRQLGDSGLIKYIFFKMGCNFRIYILWAEFWFNFYHFFRFWIIYMLCKLSSVKMDIIPKFIDLWATRLNDTKLSVFNRIIDSYICVCVCVFNYEIYKFQYAKSV